jgi:hypothetical protein
VQRFISQLIMLWCREKLGGVRSYKSAECNAMRGSSQLSSIHIQYIYIYANCVSEGTVKTNQQTNKPKLPKIQTTPKMTRCSRALRLFLNKNRSWAQRFGKQPPPAPAFWRCLGFPLQLSYPGFIFGLMGGMDIKNETWPLSSLLLRGLNLFIFLKGLRWI